jgi:hypothetical protein
MGQPFQGQKPPGGFGGFKPPPMGGGVGAFDPAGFNDRMRAMQGAGPGSGGGMGSQFGGFGGAAGGFGGYGAPAGGGMQGQPGITAGPGGYNIPGLINQQQPAPQYQAPAPEQFGPGDQGPGQYAGMSGSDIFARLFGQRP